MDFVRDTPLIKRIPRHHVLIFLLYLGFAILVTYPVITSLSTQFLGGDNSDVYEMARHVWWFKYALQHGQDIFWQSNLGYPDGFSGVTLWANPLQFFPMWLFAFVMPLAMAYNITILLTMALNGWAMYYLAWNRLGRRAQVPALIAGLVFQVFPVFQGHLFDGHAGLMVQWALPLLVHSLFEWMEKGERRWFWLSVLFFLLTPSGHMIQIIYALVPIFLLFILARLYKGDFVGMTRIGMVGIVGGLIMLVFLSPVIGETLQTRQYTEAGGYVRYSMDLLGIVSPSFFHPLWKDIVPYSSQVLGTNLAEGSSYLGVIVGLLVLVGAIFRRDSRWWLLLGFVVWWLALGPILKVMNEPVTADLVGYETVVPVIPNALLVDLPIVNLARTPGRYLFVFAMAVAMLAGYGMSVLWERFGKSETPSILHPQYALIAVLMLLIIGDYQFFWFFPTKPAYIPQAIYDLREREDIRAVFDVPYSNLLVAKEALYLQTAHEKSLIAGQVSRETPVDPAKLALLQSFETPLLTDAGADIVIIHKQRAEQTDELDVLMESARVHLGEPSYEDDLYAVFDVPTLNAVPEASYSVTPEISRDVSYIYKEQPGWMEYTALLTADNRRVHMALNGERLHTWQIDGGKLVSLPLPIGRRGYNTLTIELDPPCPEHYNAEVLVCRDLTIENINLSPLTTGPIYDPIEFASGIELGAYYLPQTADDKVSVRLWWIFNEARSDTDVRFVHLLDHTGKFITQSDVPLGNLDAGVDWTETVDIDLSDLPDGEYTLLTGWYMSPSAVRYDVLTNAPGAENDTVILGTFSKQSD